LPYNFFLGWFWPPWPPPGYAAASSGLHPDSRVLVSLGRRKARVQH